MRADIKHGRNIVKYKKGEIPKIYDSSLTCFETLSYTYDDKGRVAKEENSDGSSVSYEYDALGKCVSTVTAHDNYFETKLANINPIRYRCYYYDNETGYYYLQSRYYDPDICRFINSDNIKYVDKGNFTYENTFI